MQDFGESSSARISQISKPCLTEIPADSPVREFFSVAFGALALYSIRQKIITFGNCLQGELSAIQLWEIHEEECTKGPDPFELSASGNDVRVVADLRMASQGAGKWRRCIAVLGTDRTTHHWQDCTVSGRTLATDGASVKSAVGRWRDLGGSCSLQQTHDVVTHATELVCICPQSKLVNTQCSWPKNCRPFCRKQT